MVSCKKNPIFLCTIFHIFLANMSRCMVSMLACILWQPVELCSFVSWFLFQFLFPDARPESSVSSKTEDVQSSSEVGGERGSLHKSESMLSTSSQPETTPTTTNPLDSQFKVRFPILLLLGLRSVSTSYFSGPIISTKDERGFKTQICTYEKGLFCLS